MNIKNLPEFKDLNDQERRALLSLSGILYIAALAFAVAGYALTLAAIAYR